MVHAIYIPTDTSQMACRLTCKFHILHASRTQEGDGSNSILRHVFLTCHRIKYKPSTCEKVRRVLPICAWKRAVAAKKRVRYPSSMVASPWLTSRRVSSFAKCRCRKGQCLKCLEEMDIDFEFYRFCA